MEHDSQIEAIIDQLVECFEQILRVERVTAQDDFFELGGDSLAAAQLMVEIEKRFAISVQPSTLIQAPTVAELAGKLAHEAADLERSRLVPIKPSGNREPIYMTHGHSGNLWVGSNLAPHLDANLPLYGIQPDLRDASFTGFDELAAKSTETLLTNHPREAYRLIGFSFGGILAFEVARQLEARGRRVSYLGLIDSPPLFGPKLRSLVRPDHREGWERFKNRLRNEGVFATVNWFIQWVPAKLRKFSSPPSESPNPDTRTPFEKKAADAFYEYTPGRYTGDITFFVTQQQDDPHKPTQTNVWDHYTTGQVNVIQVKGDHHSIAREPDISQIADSLNKLS